MNELYTSKALIAFGMDADLANNLVHTMCDVVESKGFEAFTSSQSRMPDEYFILIDGARKGPFSPAQVLALARAGRMTADHYVWKRGMKSWRCAEQIPEITRLIAAGLS